MSRPVEVERQAHVKSLAEQKPKARRRVRKLLGRAVPKKGGLEAMVTQEDIRRAMEVAAERGYTVPGAKQAKGKR